MTTRKPTHGGARPGAGRPPRLRPVRTVAVRLPEAEAAALDALCVAWACSASEAIRRVLRERVE